MSTGPFRIGVVLSPRSWSGRLHAFIEGSPLTHASMAQLRRNLALAIGASGDAAAVAALERPGDGVKNAAFSAKAPAVRDAVAWATRR